MKFQRKGGRIINRSSNLYLSSSSSSETAHEGNTKHQANHEEDDELLKKVTKDQLIDLCQKYGVEFKPKKDTKLVMLERLREHAAREAAAAEARLLQRRQIIEENDNPKERHETLDDGFGDEDDEEEAFFFFHDPSINVNTSATATQPKHPPPSEAVSRSQVIAPTPPEEPNEDGERVVTVYSTNDQNDLTGVGDAQPGRLDPDMASDSGTSASWDMPQRQASGDHERATEEVTELIGTLLASSGAPAFADPDDDDPHSPANSNTPFVGFDPSIVSSDLLTSSSRALRTGRGKVLEDVLHQFEMRAIAQDGMKGDDRERGGGHYAEVAKVRAFVEGFRRAEVRRLARETTTLLLERLMQEGVSGLDFALSTMVRSDDDTGDYAGELNDSLLDFLNDAIRHQERKVDKLVAERFQEVNDGRQENAMKEVHGDIDVDHDPVNQLWNVTIEDGQQVQSLDPNDPKVKEMLQAELDHQSIDTNRIDIPDTAPEKVLLLLTLLRERIKAEAAFAPDEKGRNLRLLAYCLQVNDDKEREGLILKDLGNSLEVS